MCGHVNTIVNHISAIHSKDTICVLKDLPNNEEWLAIPNDVPNITEDSEDSYWPNLEASIDNDKIKFKDVSIECVVCRTDVTIFPKDHVVDEEVGESHRAVILPCGHIFGASCVKQYFDMKTEQRQPASCIKCRAACYHPACGHPFYGEPVPCSIPRMAFTPHVVGKGGSIDERCRFCTIQKVGLDILLEVKRAPDRPKTVDEFLGVVLKIDGKSYTDKACADGLRRGSLERVYFPSSVADLMEGYLDRLEEKEDGQDYWMSGRLGQFGVELYVHKQQD
ncbi:hypothetical protein J7337_004778 [Fusarium musae]|uniref:RING-type domain-containing protein n=1 Tax=Fusarium musae TaxID=1042133 RepID=A0A9P8ITF8_9HYPO|nr:hypothetical protein J7337_004778 [Fusarium musae]KAG9504800.1 hypothetical protein J7337_004778 [Fusarium musae]